MTKVFYIGAGKGSNKVKGATRSNSTASSKHLSSMLELFNKSGRPHVLIIRQNKSQTILKLLNGIPFNRLPEVIYIKSDTDWRRWLPRVSFTLKERIQLVTNNKTIVTLSPKIFILEKDLPELISEE